MNTDEDKNSKKPDLLFISDTPLIPHPAAQDKSSTSSDSNKNDEKTAAFMVPKPSQEFNMPDDIIAADAERESEMPEPKPIPEHPPIFQENETQSENKEVRKKGLLRKLIQWLFIWIIIIFAIAALMFVGLIYILQQNVPDFSSLKHYDPQVTTQVLDVRKNVIAEFFTQRRFVKPLRLIPKRLIHAFLSAEDARFYAHKGYDIKSIIRAFIKNLIAGRIVQGASTITQQTARTFLTKRHKTYLRKIQELVLAIQLEQTFSKDHILYLYLNQIYLGYGAYGVEAASQNYFGKSINQLSIAECAALAGLPQAPARYAPDTNFEAFKTRQKYVLTRMYNEGYITEDEARKAFDQYLNIQPRRNRFAENAPYFSEHVRMNIESQLGEETLYKEGITIYTTVDMQMQRTAQNELEKGLRAIEKRQKYPKSKPPLQGALICMDIHNGHIKAMVGGRNFSKSRFNRAIQAIRQPGSAFKPIIYCTALDSGFSAASIIIDSPVVMENQENDFVWKPHNYEKKYYGPTTLRRALALSRNLVSIKLLQSIGVDSVIDYARRLGITSPIEKNLSIALGSSGVTLIELIRAYTVFANGGYLIDPINVIKIENQSKETIPFQSGKEKKQVIDAETSYCMTHMLQAVIQQGTAKSLKDLKHPIAGKTGSTNNLYDAWFIGYTPKYITGVWVGFDQPESIGEKETGARAALPIWKSFMKEILGGQKVLQFKVPSGVTFTMIDADTGTLPKPGTKNTVYECFKEGTEPNPLESDKAENVSQDTFFKDEF
jgi:penicillin-binding protein 1A